MRVKFNIIQGFVSIKEGAPTIFLPSLNPHPYFRVGPHLLDGPALLQIGKKLPIPYLFILITSIFHMVSQK